MNHSTLLRGCGICSIHTAGRLQAVSTKKCPHISAITPLISNLTLDTGHTPSPSLGSGPPRESPPITGIGGPSYDTWRRHMTAVLYDGPRRHMTAVSYDGPRCHMTAVSYDAWRCHMTAVSYDGPPIPVMIQRSNTTSARQT